MDFFNSTLNKQIEALPAFIQKNEYVWNVLNRAKDLDLPNWYIGAGCLVQTVWNIQSGFIPHQNIKDIDLVYFDAEDISKEHESETEEKIRYFFKDIPLPIDVKNQARVHTWYEAKFGYKISPYRSTEDAINTWPTFATSIAMRYDGDHELKIYAPFGLNDVFGIIARANKTQITRDIFDAKVFRWKEAWPLLHVIPWDES